MSFDVSVAIDTEQKRGQSKINKVMTINIYTLSGLKRCIGTCTLLKEEVIGKTCWIFR
jgi:hypothetical protein